MIIADIANELHRQRSEAMKMGPPDWMIAQGLRVEVNEYDLLEAWHHDHNRMTNGNAGPPTEIMGVRIYTIPDRFGFQPLPAPGWRIINPFVKPAPTVPNYGSPFMKTPA